MSMPLTWGRLPCNSANVSNVFGVRSRQLLTCPRHLALLHSTQRRSSSAGLLLGLALGNSATHLDSTAARIVEARPCQSFRKP